jgi:hypothetical protein
MIFVSKVFFFVFFLWLAACGWTLYLLFFFRKCYSCTSRRFCTLFVLFLFVFLYFCLCLIRVLFPSYLSGFQPRRRLKPRLQVAITTHCVCVYSGGDVLGEFI